MENDYSININTNEYTIEIDKEPDIAIELNEQGPPGSSGNGIDHIEVIEETQSYTKYRIIYTDQEAGHYDYIVYNGDKGDKGDTGEPGTTDYDELQNKPIFSTGLTDTSGTITVTDYDKLAKNTATGSSSISFGSASDANGNYSIAIGSFAGTSANKNYGIAIGTGARSTNSYAIQIGVGTNSTSNSLRIGFDNNNNYQLLDGTTGLIPDTRLSTNIARSSNIPTTASDIGALPDTTTINNLTTESQQAALNSGITSSLVTQIGTNQSNITMLQSTKQDTISDLATIREGASNGWDAYLTIQNYGNIVTHNTNEFAPASALIGVAKTYVALCPALTSVDGICEWTIQHGIQNMYPSVKVFRNGTYEEVIISVKCNSTTLGTTTVKINSLENISANEYIASVIG